MGNPQIWFAIGRFIKAIFVGVGAGAGTGYTFAVAVARIAVVALISKALAPNLDLTKTARAKLLTVRDPIAPQSFVYGEDMLSGPIIIGYTRGTDNPRLILGVALTGHELDSFQGYRLDDYDITLANLAGAYDGIVTSGDKYVNVAELDALLGTATQIVPGILAASPFLFTSAHRGRGWSYMVWEFTLVEDNDDFQRGAPQNIRAIVRGKKLYDPRLDDTNGGTGLHRLNDITTWEWTDNPALCLADFIMDTRFGMKEGSGRIDWPLVIIAADICDELVTIPGATTQKRYTCNATFKATERRGNVRDQILLSMIGRMVFSQGLWKMWAGAAITPDVTLTEVNLSGAVQLQASTGAKERYNRVRGKFIDPSRNYTAAAYPEQRSTTYEAEDGGEVRSITADFMATNNDYEAQRKAIITLRASRNQRFVIFQGNWSCLRIQPGTTVLVDIDEYGFAGEKFFVTEWAFGEQGIQLTMLQERDSVWTDPIVGEYTTRSATGVLDFADQGVPVPTAASATNIIGGVLIQWTSPPQSMVAAVEVWASDDNVRSNAQLVATIQGSEYVDQISDQRTRFYWLRSVSAHGTFSAYEPDLTTTTLIGQNLVDATIASIPSFAPGYIGGSSNFVYTLNASIGGSADDGEIRVQGTAFQHPDGVGRFPDVADFAINTFYEGVVVGQFYLMFSEVAAETRFGGVAADWGTGDDTRFISVTWDSVNLWRARNNSGTYYALTPLVTDCIIAVCSKITASGGIEAIIPLTSGLSGDAGYNAATLTAYQRAAAQPTVMPTDGLTYTFADPDLWTPGGLWSKTIPAYTTDPVWAVSATAFSNTATDTIATADWSTAVKLAEDGTAGGDGLNVATVYIYKRTSTTAVPATPTTASATYTFADGTLDPVDNGWTKTVPAGSGGEVLWVSLATASNAGATDEILNTEWQTAQILSIDGASNIPNVTSVLDYDDLDTTQLAAGASRYAMLTDRATNTSGSQNNFHLTDGILINEIDLDGINRAKLFADLELGDRIVYYISAERWFLFEVDELFAVVGSASKVGVNFLDSRDYSPTTTIPTTPGTTVQFQFQKPVTETHTLLLDPDFDLTTGVTGVQPWIDDTKDINTIGSSTVVFNTAGGANGSNSFTLTNATSGGGVSSCLTAIKSARRVRTNFGDFQFRVRYKTSAAVDAFQIHIVGFDGVNDSAGSISGSFEIDLPNTSGAWTDFIGQVSPAFDTEARFFYFQVGIVASDLPSSHGFGDSIEIDSVFVYPAINQFGTNVESTKVTPGSVPESDTATDSGKYLKADGTWDNPPGGSASNSFATHTVDDTDTEYTWAAIGSAIADSSTDTLKWVSGAGVNIDVDAALDAIRISAATHTGQVIGSVDLSLTVSAITAQAAAGALIGADTFLVNDGGLLREITATQMDTFFGGGVDSVTSSGAINHSGVADVIISHETAAGNKHIPTGGAAEQFLQYSASGTAVWSTITTGEVSGYQSPALYSSGGLPFLNTGITAAEVRSLISAAAASHVHSAADVTTGILAVARGGTNIASYAIGDILYASAAGILTKLAVGSNTEILTLAAGVPTWAAPAGGSFLPLTGGTLTGNVIHDHAAGIANRFDVGSSASDVDFQYRIAGVLTASVLWDSSLNTFTWEDRAPSQVVRMTLNLETGALDVNGAITSDAIFLDERAGALSDVAGKGQIWVRNNAPTDLFFTTDNGLDYVVGMAEYRRTSGTALANVNTNRNMDTNSVAEALVNGCWYKTNTTVYTLTTEPSTGWLFPVGCQISIWNAGASANLQITEGSGSLVYILDGAGTTRIVGGTMTIAPGGYCTLIRESTTIWRCMGAGLGS